VAPKKIAAVLGQADGTKGGTHMTLEDIKRIPKEFLTAADVAAYLQTDPSVVRYQAHEDHAALGFPVVVLKSRVKIPKDRFIEWFEIGR